MTGTKSDLDPVAVSVSVSVSVSVTLAPASAVTNLSVGAVAPEITVVPRSRWYSDYVAALLAGLDESPPTGPHRAHHEFR